MPQDLMDKMLSQFPLEEEFIDYSGHSRRFRISMRKRIEEDFNLEASEISQKEGYYFEIYSPVYSAPALGLALGKLRQKVHKGLSTRYSYVDSEGKRNLTQSEMSGRISHNGIVVDGAILPFKDLERILTTNEGFEVFISIRSASE